MCVVLVVAGPPPHRHSKKTLVLRTPFVGDEPTSPGPLEGTLDVLGNDVAIRDLTATSTSAPALTPPPARNAPAAAAPTAPAPGAALALSRSGYYTKPALEVLQRMAASELAAVSNFEIGCRGIGSVTFRAPVDLRNEDDLCATVAFDSKSVVVYPDEDRKPDVGAGLNQPAIVRLEGCYPVDKDTSTPVTDSADRRVVRKIEKLRATPDTVFRAYDPKTGAWEFSVEHFSRYGTATRTSNELARIAREE